MAPSAVTDLLPTASKPAPMHTEIKDVDAMSAMAHRGKALPSIPKFASHAETRQWQLEHMAGPIASSPVKNTQRASDMTCVDLNGEVTGGNTAGSINAAGFQIHSAVHRARPDVHAIRHTHSVCGRAWSAFSKPLEMLNQDVCYFYNAHSVYADYGGIANEASEGERIAASLGSGKAYLFCLMERSCKVQLAVEVAGLEKHFVSDEEAAYNFKMASTPETLYCEFQPHLKYEEYKCRGDYKA
ncbi:class II Aldolase and Adducin domain-containing protein [Colletotrichum graminicola]|nr:class II Aldolase and Adducin domain-containing protein [Colletotrichum graminicola]